MNNKLEELYNKIDDIVFDTSDDCRLPVSEYYKGQILSLIEEYAISKAIEFAEWTQENGWEYAGNVIWEKGTGTWYGVNEQMLNLTTKELYKIFTNTLNSK